MGRIPHSGALRLGIRVYVPRFPEITARGSPDGSNYGMCPSNLPYYFRYPILMSRAIITSDEGIGE